MYLIFDTETAGLPHSKSAPVEDLENWPRLVQIAWQLHDATGALVSAGNHIIKPDGFTIPFNAEKVHGISTARALEVGENLIEILNKFTEDVKKADILVGHNIEFDNNIIGAEYLRSGQENLLSDSKNIDTCIETVEYCQLQGGIGGIADTEYNPGDTKYFEDINSDNYFIHNLKNIGDTMLIFTTVELLNK